jgi:Zn-dependent M28 family amino/carboxypeptidase
LIVISGTILFSILNLISLVNASFEPALLVIGILVLICGIPLLFLDYGNKSPGAIDNASGVGLVLHLAEILAVYPGVGGKLNIRVLITGAEELGVKGALAYLQQNAAALRNLAQRGGLQVLNFDGIGVDGKLYVVGSDPSPSQANGTDLYHLVRQSAGELGIPLGRFLLPGAMFDHIPFAEEGYDALSLVGVGKGSSSVHTSGDSPEKLHIKGFDQAGRLALRVVEKYCGEQINQE